MTKRDALAEAATDYALEQGLIGLSLRPLAAGIGTSDRMLIYHFGSKDDLVDVILTTSNSRSMQIINAMPPSPTLRQAVLDLWSTYSEPQMLRCQRMYVEAAALGLFGSEPYAASVRETNQSWIDSVAGHLSRSGVPAEPATRLATLIDATFNGICLDRQFDDEVNGQQIVDDLAEALAG